MQQNATYELYLAQCIEKNAFEILIFSFHFLTKVENSCFTHSPKIASTLLHLNKNWSILSAFLLVVNSKLESLLGIFYFTDN